MAVDAISDEGYQRKELWFLDAHWVTKTRIPIRGWKRQQAINLSKQLQPSKVPKPFRHIVNNNVSQLRSNHVKNSIIFHIDEHIILPSP